VKTALAKNSSWRSLQSDSQKARPGCQVIFWRCINLGYPSQY